MASWSCYLNQLERVQRLRGKRDVISEEGWGLMLNLRICIGCGNGETGRSTQEIKKRI